MGLHAWMHGPAGIALHAVAWHCMWLDIWSPRGGRSVPPPHPKSAALPEVITSDASDAGRGLELAAELGQLLVADTVGAEEGRLIGLEGLEVRLEPGISPEDGVSGEGDRVRVCTLHVREVGVVELQPVLGPRPPAGGLRALHGRAAPLRVLRAAHVALRHGAGAVLEGPADGVGAAERHDVLVVHAVLVEDVAEVRRGVLRLRPAEGRQGVGQAEGRGRGLGGEAVHAAVPDGDLRAAHELDGRGGAQLDEVRPGDAGHLVLDRLQVDAQGLLEAGVRPRVDLVVRADGADGAARLGPGLAGVGLVEGAGVVPGQPHKDRPARLLLDQLLDESLCLKELLLLLCGRAAEKAEAREATGHAC
mmetsp:Transcript_16571/g.44997  ORF Transcript_16571/g.44997 Transcript_16571/m.44997 type:complete len:362 (+) Transcript_16571:240-1325(+)